jgi:adenine phosphoribosyltransferase
MLVSDLRKTIREVPDFPKPGVVFYDVTTLFRQAEALRSAVDRLVERFRGEPIDAVAAVEARGFVLGAAMAYRLGVGLILARRPGKLPSVREAESYTLEYGEAALEVHRDAVGEGQRILVVDDVLATGGTAAAVARLVQRLGGSVEGYGFLIELAFLGGRARLGSDNVFSLIRYDG